MTDRPHLDIFHQYSYDYSLPRASKALAQEGGEKICATSITVEKAEETTMSQQKSVVINSFLSIQKLQSDKMMCLGQPFKAKHI